MRLVFIAPMRVMFFLKRLVPQGFAGIPAVHLEDNTGICLGQRIQKLDRHVDLGAVFWTAAAQTIAQGKNHPC